MKVLFFITISFLFSNHLLANEESFSSRENRSEKKYDISVSPIGLSIAPIPSYGLSAGYFINSDLLIEFSYDTGKINIFSLDLYSQSSILKIKKYFSNSFYGNFGFGYRTIGIKDTITLDETNKTENINLKANSFVVEISLGNKWQWKNFNIGCDWLGVLVPISSSKKSDLPEKMETSDKERYNKTWNNIADVTTFQLFKFNLGWSL